MQEDREEQVAKERQFWEKRYGRPLTDEDLREIRTNLSGYFTFLAKMDKPERQEEQSTPPELEKGLG